MFFLMSIIRWDLSQVLYQSDLQTTQGLSALFKPAWPALLLPQPAGGALDADLCFCRKNTHLQYWSAVLGLHAQSAMNSQEVQIRQVDRIIINKKYDRRTKEADIAMMHLQQPVNFTGQWQRSQDEHSAHA